jgi:hypothetical protein
MQPADEGALVQSTGFTRACVISVTRSRAGVVAFASARTGGAAAAGMLAGQRSSQ